MGVCKHFFDYNLYPTYWIGMRHAAKDFHKWNTINSNINSFQIFVKFQNNVSRLILMLSSCHLSPDAIIILL
jgi:hypothetical protein